MRKAALFISILLCSFYYTHGQSKSQLKTENALLKDSISNLLQIINAQQNSIRQANIRLVDIHNTLLEIITQDSIIIQELNKVTSPITGNLHTSATYSYPVKSQNINNRCIARTAKGTQCSRNAKYGSEYCWQHQNTSVSPKSYSGGSKTVHVRGYYRKDGTYVRPHTRRSPR